MNFSQLVAFVRACPDCQVGVPREEPPALQARCFARGGVPTEIIQLFEAMYSKEAAERNEAPLRAAQEFIKSERYEAARANLEQGCRLQSHNWVLLLYVGLFLANKLHEHDSALEVARRALLLNHLDPDIWNLLGD